MASEKNLQIKNEVVKEITDSIKNSESVILFSYQGLTVSNISDLRTKLKDAGATMKVYKNTLTARALEELKINLDDFMTGPNAIAFSENLLEPIKVISDFAKENDKMQIRVGIISGEVADLDAIKEYASIPSREGLLTMLAGGMIQYVKELSVGLNLYAVQLNDGKPIDTPKEEVAPVKEETPKAEEPATEPEEPTETETVEETPAEEVPVSEETTEPAEEPTTESTDDVELPKETAEESQVEENNEETTPEEVTEEPKEN